MGEVWLCTGTADRDGSSGVSEWGTLELQLPGPGPDLCLWPIRGSESGWEPRALGRGPAEIFIKLR